MNTRTASVALSLVLIGSVYGCGGGASSTIPGTHGSPVVFHFRMIGDATGVQDFRASATDEGLIARVRSELQLPEGQRHLHIDGGIAAGGAGVNLIWKWHFIPDKWSLAEVSIELCDGNTVIVDQAVDYWVSLGKFCPWRSYVAYEVMPGQ